MYGGERNPNLKKSDPHGRWPNSAINSKSKVDKKKKTPVQQVVYSPPKEQYGDNSTILVQCDIPLLVFHSRAQNW